MKLSEIKTLQGLIVVGEDREITNVNTIANADENSLIFFNGKGELKTKAKAIIISNRECIFDNDLTTIISPDPKLTMAKVILECFYNNVVSFLNTIRSEIYLSKIFDNVKIGVEGVIVGVNCTIGTQGFGYVWDKDHWLRFPHIGSVVLEKNVEIGNNTCIDRGSIGNTIIRKGVKIDNLVHIAHNADIGEHSLIVAGAVIGGSVKIGKKCFIGMNASIKNGIIIGDNVTVGAGAVVLKDIPSGETWAGVPAKKL